MIMESAARCRLTADEASLRAQPTQAGVIRGLQIPRTRTLNIQHRHRHLPGGDLAAQGREPGLRPHLSLRQRLRMSLAHSCAAWALTPQWRA